IRIARRSAQCDGALRDDNPDERRHCRHAAGAAAARAAMVAAVRKLCHGGLHQRIAGRRNPCGHLTIPVILPLVDGSWRGFFAAWSTPMFLIAFVTMGLAPKPRRLPSGSSAEPRLWWPNWRNKQIWQIGFLFGSVNSVYFCSNAFLPGYLIEAG